MQDHLFARLEAGGHLGIVGVLVPDGEGAQARHAVPGDEHRPLLPLAEQRRHRHRDEVLAAPDPDPGHDAEAVAEAPPVRVRTGEAQHHGDALLLDAEGRHLGDRCRRDAIDHRAERGAAPALDRGRIAGADRHGVARQQVDRDLEVGRIPQLQQRRAGERHLFALGHHRQHLSGGRGLDLDAVAGLGRALALDQRRAGALELALVDHEAGSRGVQPGLGQRQVEQRLLVHLLGHDPLSGQRLGPLQRLLREVELRLGLLLLGLRLLDRRLRRRHVGFGDRPGPRIEQRRLRRLDRGHRLPLADRIAGLEAEPQQLAGDRRRDGEDVADPAQALVLDAHLDRPPLDGGGFGRQRPRPQRPAGGERDAQHDETEEDAANHVIPSS